MAIVTNGRLEYEMSTIDVTYPDVGKVTYRGSYPLIVSNQWTPPAPPAPPPQVCTDCLTFTGKDSEFTLKATNKTWDGTLEWSTDQRNWTALADTEEMQSVDKKLYLRGKGNTKFFANSKGTQWVLSEKADCTGNIQTLLDWENPPTSINERSCYKRMFFKCTNLATAPELPATTLTDDCYFEMFNGCTNLTTAPKLPATTLAIYCYFNMFNGCTNLTSAPELPATTLVLGCYYEMFEGCIGLTSAPALPATTLAGDCYEGMFSKCTNLTSAPVLPATTLGAGCYSRMFSDCINLASAPVLPATDLSLPDNCYSGMFLNCTSLTTPPVLPATTLAQYCYDAMFWGCTSLTTAPELPATTLADGCYKAMFVGCKKLKVNATSGNKIFTCPSTIPTEAVTRMFDNTGGEFIGTPTAGTTYYWTE